MYGFTAQQRLAKNRSLQQKIGGFTIFLISFLFHIPTPPFSLTSSHAGGVPRHPHPRNWYNVGQVTYKFVFVFVICFLGCWFVCSCWFVGLCVFPAFLGSFRFLLFFVYLPVASFLPFFLLFWQIDQKAKNKNRALENYRSTKPEAKLFLVSMKQA